MSEPKLLIFTYGTRGDVEPFIALARGLQAAGVAVRLATSRRYREWVESHGIPAVPMNDASLAFIDTPDGKAMLEGTSLPRRLAAGVRLVRRAGPMNDVLMEETWEAARDFGPDLVVYHTKLFGAPHVAERLGIPAVLAALQPMFVPTREAPAMGLPPLPLPGWNRRSYGLVHAGLAMFRRRLNRFRRETLGLPPVRTAREVLFPPGAGTIPVLHAFSPAVWPRPADWPANAVLTGYWRLAMDEAYRPPDELASFLAAGPAPVFVGFGSMTSGDPRATAALVAGALRRAGVRGIVASGWAGLEVAPSPDILAIPPVPYRWLFPRMAAVVHHGGAGTTAEGFHAGVPCVICPFVGDQPGWARLSVALGIGADPVPRRRLDEARLAAAIEKAVTDPELKRNAGRLASRLAAEDGIATACRQLSGLLGRALQT